MTVRRILRWLPLLVLLTADVTAEAQRDRSQNPARQRKAQIKRQKERNDQKEAAFRQGRKDHWKAQDRSTRKRWRAQRRAAKRMRRGGGPDSWYQGMFRSGKPIPWTRRAANKVGNLFKRKRKRRSY
ncbi:MAG: hypothetical protein ACPF8Y_09145 [Flavobacteriales bacterium]